jgi:hypothetical protein
VNSIKLLAICVFGAAAVAGCASSSPTPAVASAQRNVQSGKVIAFETSAIVNQSAVSPSSGSSTVVTTASSSGPSSVTVLLADGTQQKYIVENPSTTYTVGEPVYVITRDDSTIIAPR